MRKKDLFLIFVFSALYAAAVSALAARHEVWRDEAGVFSAVRDSRSLPEMFRELRNYGHPNLWYILLYTALAVSKSSAVLKITHILIAILGTVLFLSKAPFRWPTKLLFIFGVFPFYHYAVISRNYALSLPFIYLFCASYYERWKRPAWLAVLLAFLANTNALSLVLVLCASFSMGAEYFFMRRKNPAEAPPLSRLVPALVILLSGVLFSLWQVIPDGSITSTGVYHLAPAAILKAAFGSLFTAVFLPGNMFEVLNMTYVVLTSCVLWAIYALLAKRPFVLLFLVLGMTALDLFFHIIYHGSVRHQGFLYLLLVAVLWISYDAEKRNAGPKSSKNLLILEGFLLIIFSLQIYPAFAAARLDWTRDFSSSQKTAHFILQDPALKNAILMCEPDDFVQPLAYYLDNPIYIPREKRFGKIVRYTTVNQRDYSLGKWLRDAKTLKHREHRPVLLLVAMPLEENGPFEIPIHYGRRFTYTRDSLETFKNQTTHLASFQKAYYGENYEVFLLK